MTALIDLGFALLIIFMISTPLIEKEQMLEMDLPTSDQNQSSDPQDSVDLLVTSEGYQIDNNKVGMVELESELKRYGEMSDPPVMAIRSSHVFRPKRTANFFREYSFRGRGLFLNQIDGQSG